MGGPDGSGKFFLIAAHGARFLFGGSMCVSVAWANPSPVASEPQFAAHQGLHEHVCEGEFGCWTKI